MWIFARRSFLYIAAHESDKRLLTVRARFEGDIEEFFPEADVAEMHYEDYRFCVSLNRDRVCEVICQRVKEIDYGNLVNEVQGQGRRWAYQRVENFIRAEQEKIVHKERFLILPIREQRVYTIDEPDANVG
jgi:hypothetical protein